MCSELKIRGAIDSFYAVISGKKEDVRDWDRLRDLFFENAHIMSVRFNGNECVTVPKNIQAYILGLDEFLRTRDFYEYGLNYEINIFGNIAHVYSEYEAMTSLDDVHPIKKGINLVQLINDGKGWKILNMLWQDK